MRKKIYFILIFSLYYTTSFASKPITKIPDEPKASGRFHFTPSAGTYLKLNNVLFRLTEDIFLKIPYVEGKLISKVEHHYVNFDDPKSFKIEILNGSATIEAENLCKILSKIFDLPESNLKDLNISFIDQEIDGKKIKKLKLLGKMKLGIWIKFQMIGSLSLNKKDNVLVLTSDKIKALGVSAKGLMQMVGLNLEKMVSIPKGKGVEVKENSIIISPFRILPNLDLTGYVEKFELRDNDLLYLKFYNKKPSINFPPMPDPSVKNYLFICNGDVKFGKLMMRHTILQMIDMDDKDWFDFYLIEYFNTLTKGISYINFDGSVRAFLPDYDDAKK